MYPIPPTETLVQTKTCRHCQASFPITDKDLEFYEKVSPVFPTPLSSEGRRSAEEEEGLGVRREWYKIRYLIPPPTLCPDCRQQRRLSFRNERKLYKRKCDATNKDIISIYSPDKPFTVYHQDYWWSDKWDPMEYWRDFDFERGFFEQFEELLKRVPSQGLLQRNGINSEYTSDSEGNKNCYLCYTSWESQDSMYSTNIFWSQNCVDGYWINRSRECYEGVSLDNCISLTRCSFCTDCSFWIFLEVCQNVSQSMFCFDLKNKNFCYLNKQYSETEFKKLETNYWQDLNFRIKSRESFELLKKDIPRKTSQFQSTENVIGEYVSDSKDCLYAFDTGMGSHNVRYSYQANSLEDAMDVTVTWSNETHSRLYEWLCVPASDQALCNITVWESHDMYYDVYCYSSSHLFWCIGLRNKSYCILNKEYTKDEYEALVPRIIEHMMKTGEWGEFFPSTLSPFGYNETVAMEYYPLTREEVMKTPLEKGGSRSETEAGGLVAEVKYWETRGLIWSNPPNPASRGGQGETFLHWPVFNWSDYEAPFPKVEKIIPADKLPDDISKIPDDILNWAIECEVTKKPFRIIKQELEFYRKHNLPIPRRHPDQRHLDRMALRNPRKLFERKCDKCGVEMVTTYAPERKEAVYCEKCYEKEVIG